MIVKRIVLVLAAALVYVAVITATSAVMVAQAAPRLCTESTWASGASVQCLPGSSPRSWTVTVTCPGKFGVPYTVNNGWRYRGGYPLSVSAACPPGVNKTGVAFHYRY